MVEFGSRLEQARYVGIVGGGLVGCEIAGEIAAKWPNKTVYHLELLIDY